MLLIGATDAEHASLSEHAGTDRDVISPATGLLSAWPDDVTTVLVVAPVTILVCRRLGVPVVPFPRRRGDGLQATTSRSGSSARTDRSSPRSPSPSRPRMCGRAPSSWCDREARDARGQQMDHTGDRADVFPPPPAASRRPRRGPRTAPVTDGSTRSRPGRTARTPGSPAVSATAAPAGPARTGTPGPGCGSPSRRPCRVPASPWPTGCSSPPVRCRPGSPGSCSTRTAGRGTVAPPAGSDAGAAHRPGTVR